MGVDLAPRAPAKAAKARQRSSVTPAQRLAAEDAAIKAKEPTRKAGVVAQATPALAAAHAAVGTTDAAVYGRVRMHAVPKADGAAGGDDRRNCLAEKGWARRAVVVHSVSSYSPAPLFILRLVMPELWANATYFIQNPPNKPYSANASVATAAEETRAAYPGCGTVSSWLKTSPLPAVDAAVAKAKEPEDSFFDLLACGCGSPRST